RENIFETEPPDRSKHLTQLKAILADAGDVNVRSKPSRARCRTNADGILPGRSASIARDAAGHDARRHRQVRRNLEQSGFAGDAARHDFDDMAKAAAFERFP